MGKILGCPMKRTKGSGLVKWAGGLLALSLMLTPAQAQASDGTSYVYDGYTYDFYGNAKESPAMFLLERTITVDNLQGIPLSGVNDVCTSRDGRIFIIDTLERSEEHTSELQSPS